MTLKINGLWRAVKATNVNPVVARCGGYIQVSYALDTGDLLVDGHIDFARKRRRPYNPSEITVCFTDRRIPVKALREAVIQAVCFHLGQFQPM